MCAKPAELLDIYPTLTEMLKLPKNKTLEGHSLVPQLKNAQAEREWPAITTHNHDNHGVRSEHWRFIQYADGSQELYDMRKDPNEWNNLAHDSKYAEVIAQHKKYLPKENRMPAPGSSARILTYKDGKVIWQGEEVKPNDPIPGLD